LLLPVTNRLEIAAVCVAFSLCCSHKVEIFQSLFGQTKELVFVCPCSGSADAFSASLSRNCPASTILPTVFASGWSTLHLQLAREMNVLGLIQIGQGGIRAILFGLKRLLFDFPLV